MRDYPGRWFLSGGWSVDAWLGRHSRDHPDVDIGLFRDDERTVFEFFDGWHMAAHDTPEADHDDQWDGHPLGFPAHIHARHNDQLGLELDLNFNERSDDRLLLLRDPMLEVPMEDAWSISAWGVPTLAPEIVLWFKAWSEPVRARDEQDLKALLPLLDHRQRDWLSAALAGMRPDHPWLERLR